MNRFGMHDVWVDWTGRRNVKEGWMTSAEVCEEEQEATERLTYQIALRTLGAWLDAHGAESDIRILETMDGFVVQGTGRQTIGIESSRTITFDRVWQLSEDKKYRRRSRTKDGGFQNLLRAVGHELDEADAHTILLEQIDEELLLTYVYPRYEGGYAVVKHFTVIAPEGRQHLLRAAQNRRKPGKIAKGIIRLMVEA
jgi:hypothetical protein